MHLLITKRIKMINQSLKLFSFIKNELQMIKKKDSIYTKTKGLIYYIEFSAYL